MISVIQVHPDGTRSTVAALGADFAGSIDVLADRRDDGAAPGRKVRVKIHAERCGDDMLQFWWVKNNWERTDSGNE